MAPSSSSSSPALNLSLSLRSKLPAVLAKIPLDTLGRLIPKLGLSTILQALPKLGKILVCLLFLLNIRSWPTFWHFRVFGPVFRTRFSYARMRLLAVLSLKSRAQRIRIEDRWLDDLSPVGQDPFGMVVGFKGWVGPDDSDFNGHLSNSSYAKILDTARFTAAIAMFPMFLTVGGWTPLAGTHYNFVREIPMLASYEIHSSIAAWDQKWLYVLSKFVSKAKPKPKPKPKAKLRSKEEGEEGKEGKEGVSNGGFVSGISSTGTPYTSDTNTPAEVNGNGTAYGRSTVHSTGDTTGEALNAVLSGLSSTTTTTSSPSSSSSASTSPSSSSSTPETLHTTVVSQICFKIGRITVPPAIVLAINGFTGTPGHSLAHPHPGWDEAKRIMSRTRGGSGEALAEFLKGGWRDVGGGEGEGEGEGEGGSRGEGEGEAPKDEEGGTSEGGRERERWWDAALGAGVEERRVRNLRILDELRIGLEGARGM